MVEPSKSNRFFDMVPVEYQWLSPNSQSNIFACGQPKIPIGYQSVFAWYAGIKTGVLYVSPGYLKAHPHPLVNIYPIAGGWKVFPSHVDAAHAAACHRMRFVLRR